MRPNALESSAALESEIGGRRPAVFLDYDGTLTPIVSRPELAILAPEMRATLRRLAARWPTHIVTGRGLDDVRRLVDIDSLVYAGAHGFDIAGPGIRHEVDTETIPEVQGARRDVSMRTVGIPGVLVEDKGFSVSVHYRLVAPEHVAEVEKIVDSVLAAYPRLVKAHGKKVFELRSALDWHKGKAVLWLMKARGLGVPDFVPLYVGDDLTDEDAFRALADDGITILVAAEPRASAARYVLRDVTEVRVFLERLATFRRDGIDA